MKKLSIFEVIKYSEETRRHICWIIVRLIICGLFAYLYLFDHIHYKDFNDFSKGMVKTLSFLASYDILYFLTYSFEEDEDCEIAKNIFLAIIFGGMQWACLHFGYSKTYKHAEFMKNAFICMCFIPISWEIGRTIRDFIKYDKRALKQEKKVKNMTEYERREYEEEKTRAYMRNLQENMKVLQEAQDRQNQLWSDPNYHRLQEEKRHNMEMEKNAQALNKGVKDLNKKAGEIEFWTKLK